MKGALAAPFVFLGAAVAAWGSSQPSPAIWALSLILLGAAWLQSGRISPGLTPLGFAVWAYVVWTIASTGFISRLYNPAGLFDPIFLLVGFSLGRSLDRANRFAALAELAAGTAILACWAVVQIAFGEARGHAHFETPNTLASVLNFALAPTTVVLALGVRSRALAWLAFILFAGLCATFSRGGAVALMGGLALTLVFATPERVQWRDVARIAFLLIAAVFSIAGALAVRKWLPDLGSASVLAPTTESFGSRLELYRLAWDALGERWGWGIGYLGFRAVLEAGRTRVPSYAEENITYFVHNDYLQTLLELGILGLAALLLIVVLPFILAKRRMRPERDDRRVLPAVVAATATMAVHAIGDFPFHVPVCLLLFGLFIGIADRLAAMPQDVVPRWRSAAGRLTQILLGAGLITLLARPVIAEAAAAYGMHKWKLGEGQSAAFGLELARRFDSRDWRYHLYAGQFWFTQAEQTGKSDAATLADEAFAAGIAANPLETSNRLARVFTHIRFAQLLPAPADTVTLRAWADQALALAPLSPGVRKEYAEIVRLLEARQ
jgi:O-antigen ligase